MTRKYRPLTYLACPYSHPNPLTRINRWQIVTRACAWLIQNTGWNVFSPITHSHPLHALADLRGDWPFWKKIDTEYLKCSCRLVVFTIEGWLDSIGVIAEMEIALKLGIPIYQLQPTQTGYVVSSRLSKKEVRNIIDFAQKRQKQKS